MKESLIAYRLGVVFFRGCIIVAHRSRVGAIIPGVSGVLHRLFYHEPNGYKGGEQTHPYEGIQGCFVFLLLRYTLPYILRRDWRLFSCEISLHAKLGLGDQTRPERWQAMRCLKGGGGWMDGWIGTYRVPLTSLK